ncbi:hypothetical protein GCM10010398_56780 [Streptomyces fimbriatus]
MALPAKLGSGTEVVLEPTHLLPSGETRIHKAGDDALTEAEDEAGEAEDDGAPPATQGTSAPPAKPIPWPLDGPSPARKGARPKDPAPTPRNPSSGPHQAVRLVPRFMQPVREVLPLVQRMGGGALAWSFLVTRTLTCENGSR